MAYREVGMWEILEVLRRVSVSAFADGLQGCPDHARRREAETRHREA